MISSRGSKYSFDDTGAAAQGSLGDERRTSVRDLLYDAQQRLTAAGVPSPKTDAALLMSWVLDVPMTRLILQDEPTAEQRLAFERALARRLSRVPVQHITGRAPFRRIDVSVGPGVFIPRPETELVCEAALRGARETSAPIVVDLCAGSGAIGLSVALEAPGSTVYLVELDDAALDWARRNVREHRPALEAAGSTVELIQADAGAVADPGAALAGLIGRVDVVVSNPPYIPDGMVPRDVEVRDHDPAVALFGGPSGLDVVERVIATAALLLRPGGLVVIEHADVQGPQASNGGVVHLVRSLTLDESMSTVLPGLPGRPLFEGVQDRMDLTGVPRFTMAVRSNP